MAEQQTDQLTTSQQFFKLVYHYFVNEEKLVALIGEINAIKATAPAEHTNLPQLEQKKSELVNEGKKIKLLIKMMITDADKLCSQRGIKKFWL